TRVIRFVVGRVEGDGFAFGTVGPKFLAEPPEVVGDHRVGSFEDHGGGTVILFQTNSLRVTEVFSKALDIFNLGAAPAVDGLVVIAHGGHKTLLASQHPQPGVL